MCGTYLDNRVHEASVPKIAETTDPGLGFFTQTTISVSSRGSAEVVPAISQAVNDLEQNWSKLKLTYYFHHH